jgi:hypothetical protein
MRRFTIDYENNAETWWDKLAEHEPEIAAALRRPDVDTIDLDDDLLRRLQALPGWSGGPKHAPHPLVEIDSGLTVGRYAPKDETQLAVAVTAAMAADDRGNTSERDQRIDQSYDLDLPIGVIDATWTRAGFGRLIARRAAAR